MDDRISHFVLTAIEPEISATDGGVHKSAVMGLCRVRMGVRPEVSAGDTHPLQRNGARPLQMADDVNLCHQQLLLGRFGKRHQGQVKLRGVRGDRVAEA